MVRSLLLWLLGFGGWCFTSLFVWYISTVCSWSSRHGHVSFGEGADWRTHTTGYLNNPPWKVCRKSQIMIIIIIIISSSQHSDPILHWFGRISVLESLCSRIQNACSMFMIVHSSWLPMPLPLIFLMFLSIVSSCHLLLKVVFDQSQISMFSYEQAVSVTAAQRSALSPVQQKALAMVLTPWEDRPVDMRGISAGLTFQLLQLSIHDYKLINVHFCSVIMFAALWKCSCHNIWIIQNKHSVIKCSSFRRGETPKLKGKSTRKYHSLAIRVFVDSSVQISEHCLPKLQ